MTLDEARKQGAAPWTDVVQAHDDVTVFRDHSPVGIGHLLFVPNHSDDSGITNALAAAYREGQRLLEQKQCDGFNVSLNSTLLGPINATYPHVHLRIQKKPESVKNLVCAPPGGFGNHVRWLMFLDPYYQMNLNKQIKLETIDQKISYIRRNIYTEGRTWYNWLAIQWKYRKHIDELIMLIHNPVHDLSLPGSTSSDISQFDKIAVLVVSPELCLRSYLKFNSNLDNNRDPRDFMTMIKEFNAWAVDTEKTHSNVRIFRADNLFAPDLDQKFYQDLVSWFGLNDHYQEANFIHDIWYRSHQRAEKELIYDLTDYYTNDTMYW